jgi:hypothetical protein
MQDPEEPLIQRMKPLVEKNSRDDQEKDESDPGASTQCGERVRHAPSPGRVTPLMPICHRSKAALTERLPM